ncbi:hypothetical protein V0U79_06795 [Hyphobacterium sp. HN65]|uniref:Pilus assembly protein n=1 Tax=Hyphobacterium lacteum TaxID=3116575 RepID=A0ABU7LQ95_9PROT|nr:hypothetical protein [Hyphobacterium sp. HN65]MEE2526068.1 hypothetical protein [Hyphobacterium sp. HN65]
MIAVIITVAAVGGLALIGPQVLQMFTDAGGAF